MSNVSTPENYLLVPINVEALVVGAQVGQWTDLHPDFSRLYEGKVLGSQLAPVLFSPRPEGLPSGIHLHWALPDALTRARQRRPASPQEPLEAPEFPLIPNRWMVQRIVRKPQSTEVVVKAWVVESDYLYNTNGETPENATSFPRLDAQALFDFVGKSFDYGSWAEQQPAYRIPLTAIGYGDPAFAAYYPACKSLLGFYDPLSDIDKETSFAYVVAGWYSDPAKDILRRFTMEELKWACSSTAGSLPTQLFCHGTIYNVQWKNRTTRYSSAVPDVDDKNYQISIGNTTTEAVAALLAQKLDNPKIEPLLAAFQEDQLAQNADLIELGFTLHQQRFGSLAGGCEYVIQKKQAKADQSLSATDVTLPESLEQLLAELNALQRDLEHRQREWDGYRWELYAMWHKWAGQYNQSREEPTEITGKISALKELVSDQTQQIDALKRRRDTAEQAVRDIVQQQFAELEFVTSLAAPFWHANDPVLLISGPGLFPSQRHGQDGRYSRQDELQCRLAGQELSGLIVDVPNGQPEVLVDAAEVFRGNPFAGAGAVPKGITDRLLFEALLLDPGSADAIAEQAYVKAQLQSRPGKDKLIAEIKRLQRPSAPAPPTESSARYGGTFPSPIVLRDWERNPWLPLFLEWRIAWYPSYTNPANALDQWQLSAEEVDFQWTGGSPNLANSQVYAGYAILTPHAIAHFKERLHRYSQEHPDQDLSSVITYLDQMPVLGQALGGLNDAFIMRDQCLQIAPINPAIFAGKNESQRDTIIELVRGATFASPDPEKPFLPIRAGHMKVLAVWVVDAFGQILQLRNFDRPVRAASLRTEGQNAESLLQFTPRFAQPLRLRFEWSPTLNPPGTYPVNHPVCGWVIPNHLDKSLTFYDGRGSPLGALQKILRATAGGGTGGAARTGDKAFFWVPMPGTTIQPDAILNPHLKHFVQFLSAMDADTGTAFWNLLDEALARTDSGEPEDDPLLSLLLGRPLALVRATLGLELAGLPASDQGLQSIGNFDNKGLTKLKFPAHLGEARKETDGLIGYFTDAPQAKSSGAFYPAAGAKGTPYPGAIEYGHILALDCETPVSLTLLMDPRAKVHAITGVLPKNAVTLPPRVSSAAKSASQVFFQVAPLLSPGGAVSMPKPSDDFGEWSWTYRPQVTMWKEVDAVIGTIDQAGFATEPQQLSEGWLKLRMNPLSILNLWVKEGTLAVQPKTNITLGWTLLGGDRVSLSASEDGKDPQPLSDWTSSPLPDEYRVQVQVATTYILVLQDKDGNRSEKRLTVTLKETSGNG